MCERIQRDCGGSKKICSRCYFRHFLFQNCVNSGHITGIAVLDDSSVLTCSVDQRVSLWKMSQPDNPSELANPFQLVWQTFSHVPDLHDIVVHRNLSSGQIFVVVVGAGMQTFKIKNKS